MKNTTIVIWFHWLLAVVCVIFLRSSCREWCTALATGAHTARPKDVQQKKKKRKEIPICYGDRRESMDVEKKWLDYCASQSKWRLQNSFIAHTHMIRLFVCFWSTFGQFFERITPGSVRPVRTHVFFFLYLRRTLLILTGGLSVAYVMRWCFVCFQTVQLTLIMDLLRANTRRIMKFLLIYLFFWDEMR